MPVCSSDVLNSVCRAGEGQEGPEVRVAPMLTKCLRDHQREGLQFLFDCVTGQKTENGQGWCATPLPKANFDSRVLINLPESEYVLLT